MALRSGKIAAMEKNNLAQATACSGIRFSESRDRLIEFPRAFEGAYTIPAGVRIIDSIAFSGCEKLQKVVFSEGVEEIRYGAFQDCVGLTAIAFPASIRVIFDNAFRGCRGLREVHFFSWGIKEILDNAFAGCPIDCAVVPDDCFVAPNAFRGAKEFLTMKEDQRRRVEKVLKYANADVSPPA